MKAKDDLSLPVAASLPSIALELKRCGNAVVVAQPGSGKTTRVPSFLASLYPEGDVWVLLPKRMAAVMAAHYVASLHGEKPGGLIGYQVRYEACFSAQTCVRFVTEQMLLKRLSHDPFLQGTSCVVFDEFHERSTSSDIALSVLRAMQTKGVRSDIHLVVMSATLEAASVAQFMGCEKVCEVPGKLYPVDIVYEPPHSEKHRMQHLARVLDKTIADGQKGHGLVFLEGSYEIHQAIKAYQHTPSSQHTLCVPLYGALSLEQQQKAVSESAAQKIIFATNIAETSLTVPGVTWVVDTGFCKVMQYHPSLHMSGLATQKTSQASAVQRAGRAGRTAPGRCIRVYSEQDFRARNPFEKPDIARAELSQELLAVYGLGYDPMGDFAWFQAPEKAHVLKAFEMLDVLGAVHDKTITDTGKKMLQLPLSTRWARFVVHAWSMGVVKEACDIAAMMEEGGVFKNNVLKDTASSSDIVLLYEHMQLPSSVVRASQQIQETVRVWGKKPQKHDLEEVLLKSLLVAFADVVAYQTQQDGYVLCMGGRVKAPQSTVKHHPYVVVVGHIPEEHDASYTAKAQFLSAIDPSWLLDMDNGLLKESRQCVWNADKKKVEDVERIMYGQLVLSSHVHALDTQVGVSQMLASMITPDMLGDFVQQDEKEQWYYRVCLYHNMNPIEGVDLSSADAFWMAVLKKACEGKSSFKEIAQETVHAHVSVYVGYSVMQKIELFCPEKIVLKRGRKAFVTYNAHGQPYVSSRMQDFFGMGSAPCIGNGSVPLVCHFEAPNGRAVQVTSDVAGFWKNHYPSLRKTLARRYPKHAWPENPLL